MKKTCLGSKAHFLKAGGSFFLEVSEISYENDSEYKKGVSAFKKWAFDPKNTLHEGWDLNKTIFGVKWSFFDDKNPYLEFCIILLAD